MYLCMSYYDHSLSARECLFDHCCLTTIWFCDRSRIFCSLPFLITLACFLSAVRLLFINPTKQQCLFVMNNWHWTRHTVFIDDSVSYDLLGLVMAYWVLCLSRHNQRVISLSDKHKSLLIGCPGICLETRPWSYLWGWNVPADKLCVFCGSHAGSQRAKTCLSLWCDAFNLTSFSFLKNTDLGLENTLLFN